METIEKLLELDEFIYFLGYLWADGSLSRQRKNTTMSIQEEDAIIISPNIEKINKILTKPFTTSISKPKKAHWKTMKRFYSGDKDLYNFLFEYEYHNKSNVAPHKILNFLQKDKHRIFMLGFFDGDGCVYNGEKSYRLYSVSFSGSYDYDWTFLEDIFKSESISNKIYRNKRTKGANSCVTTTGMFEVEKIYNYLYKESDKFEVLLRKKEKFEQIIEHVKKQTSVEKGVSFCSKTKKYCAYFNKNKKRIHLGSFDSEDDAIRIRKIAIDIYEKLLNEF